MRRIFIALFALCLTTACTPAQVEAYFNTDVSTQQELMRVVITDAAVEYGVDPGLMIRIATCESGLRPDAKNAHSTASGLFQHLSNYWPGRAEAIGEPDASIFDPTANARAAALMMSTQGTSPWLSSKGCWSR